MSTYIDFVTATRLLAAQGFNKRDIECVLDLTGPHIKYGQSLWPADRIERLAARAFWLNRADVASSMPAPVAA
ncbi:MAG: hypothetical protein ACOH12_04525 [Parvibaculaceae bacterium]